MAAPKVPDNAGPFGGRPIDPKEQAGQLAIDFLYRSFRTYRREAADWDDGLLIGFQYIVSFNVIPGTEKKFRSGEDSFRGHPAPPRTEIHSRLLAMVSRAQSLIQKRSFSGIIHPEDQLGNLIESIASFYVACLVLRPFRQLNDTWALMALNALWVDCGFPPGTRFDIESDNARRCYTAALDAALENQNYGPLGELIVEGWIAMRKKYRDDETARRAFRLP